MLRKAILQGLYYSGIQKALSPLTRGMGSILMLHRVTEHGRDPFQPNYHLAVCPEFLDRIILCLKRAGYEFISMDEVHRRLSDPDAYRDAKPFLCMTLDDGYRDNMKKAVPVFRRHEVPYLIYVAPGLVEGSAPLWWEDLETVFRKRSHIYAEMPQGRVEYDLSTTEKKLKAFNELVHELLFETPEEDQRRLVSQISRAYKHDQETYARDQIMDWSQLHELSEDTLCTIGAHTINHHALAKLPEKRVRFEIGQSREVIRTELGTAPAHFAYPYGHQVLAGTREFEIAKEFGFDTAVTTRHGVVYPEHKDYLTALPRVSMNGNFQSAAYVKTLVSGVPGRLFNKGRKLQIKDSGKPYEPGPEFNSFSGLALASS